MSALSLSILILLVILVCSLGITLMIVIRKWQQDRDIISLLESKSKLKNEQISMNEQTFLNEKSRFADDYQQLLADKNLIEVQFEEARDNLRSLMNQLRNVEAQNLELKSLLNENHRTLITPKPASYQISEMETAKRIQEALEPWKIRVNQLESQIDLLRIEYESPFINQADAQQNQQKEKEISELQAKIELLNNENMYQKLKINQLISAYEVLREKLKQAETYVKQLKSTSP